MWGIDDLTGVSQTWKIQLEFLLEDIEIRKKRSGGQGK